MSRPRYLAVLLTASVVTAASGCADPAPTPDRTPAAATPAASDPGPAAVDDPTGTPASPFNATDVAWLQLHVAMAERALRLLDLVPDRAGEPAVRQLATRLRDEHQRHLRRGRSLLAGSGAPTTNPHTGHDMPGMVTAAELRTLTAARGATFRRLLLAHLREHLAQSARLAGSERTAGADPATRSLAADVAGAATVGLDALDRLERAHPTGA